MTNSRVVSQPTLQPEEHRQNTDDLAALKCVSPTVTVRQERQQRGKITGRNPVHRLMAAFQNAELPRQRLFECPSL